MFFCVFLKFFSPDVCSQGTAANARDVASMADAIDGPGAEINYWYWPFSLQAGILQT